MIPKEITLDYLEKLDNGLIKNKDNIIVSMPDLTNDKYFKIFFKSNIMLLKKFLKCILHFDDLNIEDMKISFIDKELLENDYNVHGNTYDYYININDSIYIDLELNKSLFDALWTKSLMYFFRMVSNSINVGEDYNLFKNKKFIQLNLNANPKEINPNGEEIVCFYNITNKSVYAPNIITYIRNIDYYKNLYYNNSVSKKESDYYLAMLASTSFKELYNILKSFLNKKERDRIMKDVIKLSMNMSFNEQELNNLRKEVEMMKEIYYKEKGHTEGLKQGIKEGIEQGIEQGIKEGIKEGIEQGAKENSIQIAKKLLKQGIDEEIIITTTNISKEELEKLKEI